jgi:hypothetical protein
MTAFDPPFERLFYEDFNGGFRFKGVNTCWDILIFPTPKSEMQIWTGRQSFVRHCSGRHLECRICQSLATPPLQKTKILNERKIINGNYFSFIKYFRFFLINYLIASDWGRGSVVYIIITSVDQKLWIKWLIPPELQRLEKQKCWRQHYFERLQNCVKARLHLQFLLRFLLRFPPNACEQVDELRMFGVHVPSSEHS